MDYLIVIKVKDGKDTTKRRMLNFLRRNVALIHPRYIAGKLSHGVEIDRREDPLCQCKMKPLVIRILSEAGSNCCPKWKSTCNPVSRIEFLQRI